MDKLDLKVWLMVFLVIWVVEVDICEMVVVVVLVLVSKLLVGIICEIRLLCLVLVVFMVCLVRMRFIVLVLLIVWVSCWELFMFGSMFSFILGCLNFVVLVVISMLYIIVSL